MALHVVANRLHFGHKLDTACALAADLACVPIMLNRKFTGEVKPLSWLTVKEWWYQYQIPLKRKGERTEFDLQLKNDRAVVPHCLFL